MKKAYLSICDKYGRGPMRTAYVVPTLSAGFLASAMNIKLHGLPYAAFTLCSTMGVLAAGLTHIVADEILHANNVGSSKGGKIVRGVQASTYVAIATGLLTYGICNIANDNNKSQATLNIHPAPSLNIGPHP